MSSDKIKFDNQEEIQTESVNETTESQQEAALQEQEIAVEPQVETDTNNGLEQKIAQLEAALTTSENKVAEQQDSVLRAHAEIENMRRRTEQEIDKAKKFALERFASELLPVLDNMERALELADKENEALKPMLEGIELTLKTMQDTVAKFGLKELNPIGEAFNPEFHQAMAMQESVEHAPNTVMLVMQKGYELNGRVVRPAMVMVSKAAASNVNETA